MKLATANLPTIDHGAIDAIVGAYHGDPFGVLGMHEVGEQLVVRVFRPDARAVTVVECGGPGEFPAVPINGDGFFEALLDDRKQRFAYELRHTAHDGHVWTESDPYSFGRLLGEMDTHLFNEGQHWDLHRHFGAHVRTVGQVTGTSFVVWAPNAQRVSVVGDFNGWDGRIHAMRKLLNCGVWEIFIPGIGEGAHYKFEVKNCWGALVLKSDPFAFFSQHGVQTASLVFDLERYQWSDQEWMAARRVKNWNHAPVSIYEVHLGSWRRHAGGGWAASFPIGNWRMSWSITSTTWATRTSS